MCRNKSVEESYVIEGVYFNQYPANFDEYLWKTVTTSQKIEQKKFFITKRVQLFFMKRIFSEMCIRPYR